MTSPRKSASNRRNAQKSSGPRTPAGKAKSARNSLTHGILSTSLLLPDEDPLEWSLLLNRLLSELEPVGTLEHVLVERIAVAIWRQRRLVRVEAARIQVSQRPDTVQRLRIESLVGKGNDELVAEILAGVGETERERLYGEVTRACEAGVVEPDVLRVEYPEIWQKLLHHAKANGGVAPYLAKSFNGCLATYLAWLRDAQVNILTAYAQAKTDRAAQGLPAAPDLISRYQSTLDNDLYKGMRALREAQRFRRASLDSTAAVVSDED